MDMDNERYEQIFRAFAKAFEEGYPIAKVLRDENMSLDDAMSFLNLISVLMYGYLCAPEQVKITLTAAGAAESEIPGMGKEVWDVQFPTMKLDAVLEKLKNLKVT